MCVCGRQLRFCTEIENFLSLRWCSPLWKMQTAASSVNQPLHKTKLWHPKVEYLKNQNLHFFAPQMSLPQGPAKWKNGPLRKFSRTDFSRHSRLNHWQENCSYTCGMHSNICMEGGYCEVLGQNFMHLLLKGWFTLDAAVCVFRSGLCQHRDRKFSISLQKCNCMLQMHAENAVMWMSL